MGKVEYQVVFRTISELNLDELDSLSALYLSYYNESSQEKVLADLENKSEILLLLDDNKIVGFTTYQIYDVLFKNQEIKIIYSGDTIVHHEHWGQQKLGFAWIKRLGEFYHEFSGTPFYWFLIVKGHRTYRYLPAFANTFYPHWEIDRSDLRELLNYLAKDKFKKTYNEDLGIIHYPASQGQLKSNYADPTAREKKHEAVKFFLEKNPQYKGGDELACLCEIKDENFKPLTKRLIYGV